MEVIDLIDPKASRLTSKQHLMIILKKKDEIEIKKKNISIQLLLPYTSLKLKYIKVIFT
jgi:hypothetical protein